MWNGTNSQNTHDHARRLERQQAFMLQVVQKDGCLSSLHRMIFGSMTNQFKESNQHYAYRKFFNWTLGAKLLAYYCLLIVEKRSRLENLVWACNTLAFVDLDGFKEESQ